MLSSLPVLTGFFLKEKKKKVKAVTFLPNYKILCLELRFVFGKRRKQFVSLPLPPGKNKIK